MARLLWFVWAVVVLVAVAGVVLGSIVRARNAPTDIGVSAAVHTVEAVSEAVEYIVLPRRVTVAELRALLIQRVNSICEYSAPYHGSFIFEDSLRIERFWLVPDGCANLWMSIPGTVYSSLDLTTYEIESLDIVSTTGDSCARIAIRMEPATITGVEIDPGEVLFDYPEIDWMDSDDQRLAVETLWSCAMQDATSDLIMQALDSGLNDQLQQMFVRDVENLIQTLGYEADVTVEFTPAGSGMTVNNRSDRGAGTVRVW